MCGLVGRPIGPEIGYFNVEIRENIPKCKMSTFQRILTTVFPIQMQMPSIQPARTTRNHVILTRLKNI